MNRLLRKLLLGFCWTAFLAATTLKATTWTVNSTADNASGSGTSGPLRYCINDAASGDTITFGVAGIITLTSGELVVGTSINILGPGPTTLAVSGNSTSRVFDVRSSTTASISGLTIENGSTNAPGGAVYNLGTLLMSNCVVMGSSSHGAPALAQAGIGGGIYNGGTMSLADCTVTNNFADYFVDGLAGLGGLGGSIYNAGALTLDSCVISSNWCADVLFGVGFGLPASGGGIYNTNSLTINLCTINNNHSGKGHDNAGDSQPGNGGAGGAVYNSGTLTVINSTANGNYTSGGGSGVQNGFPGGNGGSGGGFWNGGTLFMTGSTVSSNTCGNGGPGGPYTSPLPGGNGGFGGGVYNSGTLVLTNSTIVGNVCGNGGMGSNGSGLSPMIPNGGPGGAGGSGGGLCTAGTLTSACNTIYGNAGGTAGNGGNGVVIGANGGSGGNGGTGGYGGGVFNTGTMNLWNCTVASNSVVLGGAGGMGAVGTMTTGANGVAGAVGNGGGSANSNGVAQLLNTIVAENITAGTGPDLIGNFTSLGHNLIGNVTGGNGYIGSDLLNVNPQLDPLADNGGPTFTCALQATSPAIDAGDDAVLSAPYNLTTDQRGLPRKSGAHVDIGAYELQIPFAIVSASIQGSNMTIAWTAWGGSTNVLQATNGGPSGSYTDTFADIVASRAILPGTGTQGTNYTDTGGATNVPARYYRVRLVP
ncbi:MAG: choice-of-anchor Q domain-containing protein [Verrucomicrobiia bacterium]